MEPVTSQFYVFFITVAIGMIIGVIFDFYRIIRNFIRPKKFVTNIGDILFWVFITAVVFVLLVYGNWVELRLYVFIGLALGVRVYLRLFSKLLIRLFKNLFIVVGKILKLCWRGLCLLCLIIIFPFRLAKNIIIIPLGFISLTAQRVWGFVGSLFKRFVLRPARNKIYKLKRKLLLKLKAMLIKKNKK